MAYDLTSGEVARALAGAGVALSPATIQRYARDGRIPSRTTPGGRYRYNFDEVRRALATPTAVEALSRPALVGGLGTGPVVAMSAAHSLAEGLRAHRSDTPVVVGRTRDRGEAVPTADALTALQRRLLKHRLALLRQGDVISLGATTIVGRGASPTLTAVTEATEGPGDRAWAVMLVSELGWYVVLSQDCDIVRGVDVEPCLLVCPLGAVPLADWQALRSGPYSPREFPFPEQNHPGLPEGTAPVANACFVSSLGKVALLSDHFDHVPTLAAGMRGRFAAWIGRRYARVPYSDALERDVLGPCAERVRMLAKSFRDSPSGRSAAAMLVGATDEWYVGPGEQLVPFQLTLTEATAAAAGLWDGQASDFDRPKVEHARVELQRDLGRRIKAGLGYSVTVETHTLDRVSASAFRSWAPWVWDPHVPWADGDDETVGPQAP